MQFMKRNCRLKEIKRMTYQRYDLDVTRHIRAKTVVIELRMVTHNIVGFVLINQIASFWWIRIRHAIATVIEGKLQVALHPESINNVLKSCSSGFMNFYEIYITYFVTARFRYIQIMLQ